MTILSLQNITLNLLQFLSRFRYEFFYLSSSEISRKQIVGKTSHLKIRPVRELWY